jgi:hypothetical protein
MGMMGKTGCALGRTTYNASKSCFAFLTGPSFDDVEWDSVRCLAMQQHLNVSICCFATGVVRGRPRVATASGFEQAADGDFGNRNA